MTSSKNLDLTVSEKGAAIYRNSRAISAGFKAYLVSLLLSSQRDRYRGYGYHAVDSRDIKFRLLVRMSMISLVLISTDLTNLRL